MAQANCNQIVSEKIIKDFHEVFKLFDTDGDGTVDRKELGMVMRSLGQNLTDLELSRLVQSVDNDGNGTVDFNEFMKLISKKLQSVDIEEEILDAFRVFDNDGNGSISRDELRVAMTTLGEKVNEEELDELIVIADINGDGQINYNEFAKMIIP